MKISVDVASRLPPSVFPFSLASRLRQYVYVFVPKAACSTMKVALWLAEKQRSSEVGPLDGHMSVHARQYAADSPWISPASLTDLSNENNLISHENYIFSVVRNPFSRVFAAYANKILGLEKGVDKYDYLPGMGWHRQTPPNFYEFVQIVANQTPQSRNEHWRPITDVIDFSRTKFDQIFYVENLSNSLPIILNNLFGAVDESIPRLNVNSSRSERLMLDSYDCKTIDLVRNTYRDDFALLGYGEDIQDLSPREISMRLSCAAFQL